MSTSPQAGQSPRSGAIQPPSAFPAPPPISASLELSLARLHNVSINREKLSDWHHKVRSKLFPLVTGFFVRCRVEDQRDGQPAYKVGRIRQLKPDWTLDLDLITTEEIAAGRNVSNYDCISNAKITDQEFVTFTSRIPEESIGAVIEAAIRAEERLKLLESVVFVDPAFQAKKKEEKPPTAVGGATLPEKFIFSHNVLLCDDSTDTPVTTTTISELLQNAVGNHGIAAEPDTPRATAGGDPSKAKVNKPGFDNNNIISSSTYIQLADVMNYAQMSPVRPLPDPSRLIQLLKQAARNNYTEFVHQPAPGNPELFRVAISTCNTVLEILKQEPLFARLHSPCVVFGDIHGNFSDMMFFISKIVAFDDLMMRFTTTNLLFLGDYVDRGNFSVECCLFLFAMKCLAPGKVTLLRGNHESPEVNGDVDVYNYSSFKYQCLALFGREMGVELWVKCNEVFQYLPIIADIDKKIFCVHGGLPQYSGGEDNRLEIIADPSFPRIPIVQCPDPTNVAQRIMVNDLLWSDPAGPDAQLDKYGFGPNPRGPDIKTFGPAAVDQFCERYGYQYIFRAHQEKADGLRVSMSSRVVTIFSTSDYAGHQNGAGCILVHNGKMRMAIKKPTRTLETGPVLRGNISPRTLNRGTAGFGAVPPKSPTQGRR